VNQSPTGLFYGSFTVHFLFAFNIIYLILFEGGRLPDQPLAATVESDSESDAEPQATATTFGLPAEADIADASCSDAEDSSTDVYYDSEDEDVQPQTGLVKSRTGKIWHEVEPTRRHRGPQDIIRERVGLTAAGNSVETVEDCFHMFITTELVQLIVQHTNEKGERVYDDYNKKHPANQKKYIPFDEDELYACTGLLILAGVFKGKHEHYRDLWCDVDARAPFIATLSRDRFQLFLCLCRFDDKSTQKQSDNLAHVCEMSDLFNSTLTKPYIPGEFLTVDEQLVGSC